MYYSFYNKKNKYKAIKQDYNNHHYDSKFEANKAYELDLQLKAKKIKSWKPQVKIELNFKKNKKNEWILTDEPAIDLKAKGIVFRHYANYYVDFMIEHLDGSIEYLECKGLMLEPGRTKIFLLSILLEDHPTKFFTLSFQNKKAS